MKHYYQSPIACVQSLLETARSLQDVLYCLIGIWFDYNFNFTVWQTYKVWKKQLGDKFWWLNWVILTFHIINWVTKITQNGQKSAYTDGTVALTQHSDRKLHVRYSNFCIHYATYSRTCIKRSPFIKWSLGKVPKIS